MGSAVHTFPAAVANGVSAKVQPAVSDDRALITPTMMVAFAVGAPCIYIWGPASSFVGAIAGAVAWKIGEHVYRSRKLSSGQAK